MTGASLGQLARQPSPSPSLDANVCRLTNRHSARVRRPEVHRAGRGVSAHRSRTPARQRVVEPRGRANPTTGRPFRRPRARAFASGDRQEPGISRTTVTKYVGATRLPVYDEGPLEAGQRRATTDGIACQSTLTDSVNVDKRPHHPEDRVARTAARRSSGLRCRLLTAA
jgi:hypothetical protein